VWLEVTVAEDDYAFQRVWWVEVAVGARGAAVVRAAKRWDSPIV
jgi:hypothetical protein